MSKLDEIAEQYYILVGWYKKQDPYEGERLPWQDSDCNPIQIARDFYEFACTELYKPSKKVLEMHESQKRGLDYLKENVVEAMLSEEPYIREFATLIYKDQQKVEKQKRQERGKEFHRRKNK